MTVGHTELRSQAFSRQDPRRGLAKSEANSGWRFADWVGALLMVHPQ